MQRNIFNLPYPLPADEDIVELVHASHIRIERIVSSEQTTPEGEWYDQEQDEWVLLVQGDAVIEYDDGRRETLAAGDHILLPARCRHRVAYTSRRPPCIWIAVFGDMR